ncbi:MAG: hypothetical protein H7146_02275 [Burkholderiaceae bacterium]|nr:hypothetical protein [Microbacteriaceae bacterium]
MAGVRIAALGAAFTSDSDDVRDAPALDVSRMLQLECALVSVADVVALLTEWQEFRDADPTAIVPSSRTVGSSTGGTRSMPTPTAQPAGSTGRSAGRPSPASPSQDDGRVHRRRSDGRRTAAVR